MNPLRRFTDTVDLSMLQENERLLLELREIDTSYQHTSTPNFINRGLKGFEEIRFAPGMFDAKSDSFFSYGFVLQCEPEPKLTDAVVKQELLTYYRGLAEAVSE